MNCELKAKIVEANLGVIDVNGFKFNLHKMNVGRLEGFKVLIPIFDDISVGDCIKTHDWIISRIGKESNPVDLCVRVKNFELMPQEGFEVSEYLNGSIVGMFVKSEKCYLRTVGADRKPFYTGTLKIKDSYGSCYAMLICAFGKQAKKMSTIISSTIIDCVVTVKKRLNSPGYEFAVIDFKVAQEGEVK